MSPTNLGVVFGPTLIRPEMESSSSLNNLNHHNLIGMSYDTRWLADLQPVETIISKYHELFASEPQHSDVHVKKVRLVSSSNHPSAWIATGFEKAEQQYVASDQ